MIKVWDLFVRISHWLVLVLFVSAYISANYGDAEYIWHTWNGYAVFVIVVSRIIWGIVGSTTARFSYFLTSPFQTFSYLRKLLTGKAPTYLSHNPAGGWMVVFLWVLLLSQAVTGMFSSDDILVEGPFVYQVSAATVENMTAWHNLIFYILLGLIALHILAVIYHQLIKNEKLVQAMFTGKKALSESISNNKLNVRPFYISLIIIAVVSFIFYTVIIYYTQ